MTNPCLVVLGHWMRLAHTAPDLLICSSAAVKVWFYLNKRVKAAKQVMTLLNHSGASAAHRDMRLPSLPIGRPYVQRQTDQEVSWPA